MEIIDQVRYVPQEEARQVARQVADRLRHDFGATKVLLYGSVIDGFYVPGHSDIDIYFEGVSKDREGVVMGRMMTAFADYEIDFRPAGFCRDSFRQRVLERGMEI
ncbi:MAG: hypothetical protein LBK60_04930 [Verrucomicrobiales bacterium]|jgi:predicted nucleotidyltransferase|nr:hypothetical protein [Verrucomicrobiales bacterium]